MRIAYVAIMASILLLAGLSAVPVSSADRSDEELLQIYCDAYGDVVRVNRGGKAITITFEEWLSVEYPDLLDLFHDISCGSAAAHIVLMVDNPPECGHPPGPPEVPDCTSADLRERAKWSYAPQDIVVFLGDVIEFKNPASNFHSHTITAYSRFGPPAAGLTAGAPFDSSVPPHDFPDWIHQGQSFFLDTSGLAPGHYQYYCRPHPWMQGTVTVVLPE